MAGLLPRGAAVCRGWGVVATLAALPWSCAHAAPGWDGVHDRDLSGWELRLSPYTVHFSKEPHADVYLAALAKVDERGWMVGGAAFRNSCGQPSAYVFAGQKYVQPWGGGRVYWSWTAGIVYGYKPPYDDKVVAH